MRRFTSLSLMALGLLLGSAPVFAADIIEEPIYVAPAPSFAGWYIRGDAGYNFESKTRGSYNFWNPDPVSNGVDNVESYDEIKLRGSGSFGVGAGYRFSDQFRMDVTLDYSKHDVKGSSRCGYLIEDGYDLDPVNNDCRFNDTSETEIWTTMANAYVDIAHFGPITPYIGAGAGFAYVSYDKMRNEIICGTGPGCAINAPTNYVGIHEGMDDWRFAASLMAGASVDLTQQMKLDFGYRYTRISDGDAYGYDEVDRASNAKGVQGRDNGFDMHTVRAGLRYDFF